MTKTISDFDSIICSSVDDWDEMWRRPQHLMWRLRKHVKILFVEPPVYLLSMLVHPFQQYKDPRNKRRWRQVIGGGLTRLDESLFVYTPFILLPDHIFYRFPLPKVRKSIKKLNELLLARNIKKLARRIGLKKSILWLSGYDDYLIRHMPAKPVVYDCMDEWSEFAGPRENPKWKREVVLAEERVLRQAHIVFVSAKRLQKSKESFNKKIIFVPNAVDVVHFNKALKRGVTRPEDIRDIKHPIIGFIGALGEWVDYDLLRYVATQRPEWSIVLIGPVASGGGVGKQIQIHKISDLSNVHMLGKKSYQILPNYMKFTDVAIIPFVKNELTDNMNVIKMYEYLAAGKPIVSSNIAEVATLGQVVKLATSSSEFVKCIEEDLSGDFENNLETRLQLANEHSWDSAVECVWVNIQQIWDSHRKLNAINVS